MPGGYIRVWAPGHPVAMRDGYALEHRKVLHDAGVAIPPGHHVHHINGQKDDNRIENLEVLPKSEHHRHHIAEAGQVINQFGTWLVGDTQERRFRRQQYMREWRASRKERIWQSSLVSGRNPAKQS